MSAILNNLKFVAAKRPTQMPAVQVRRNKLSSKIQEQILLATAHTEGSTYAPTRIKTVTNADGDRVQVTHAKRVKPWWFVADNGKTAIAVRYGARLLELAKGKFAVEIATPNELVQTLEVIKSAVEAGELDEQMELASTKLRSAFHK